MFFLGGSVVFCGFVLLGTAFILYGSGTQLQATAVLTAAMVSVNFGFFVIYIDGVNSARLRCLNHQHQLRSDADADAHHDADRDADRASPESNKSGPKHTPAIATAV